MPQKFKALASITAWVLFIVGLVGLVVGGIVGPAAGGQFFGAQPPAIQVYLANGLAIASLTLSVVVMKLRQMLE